MRIPRGDGPPRARRSGLVDLAGSPHRPGAQAARDHRRLRLRRAAHGHGRRQVSHHFQRRDLQLPGVEEGVAGQGLLCSTPTPTKQRCCCTCMPIAARTWCMPCAACMRLALWDEQRKRRAPARDPFGIKPLYYADDGRTLRVASQVKALIRGGAIASRPEVGGLCGIPHLGVRAGALHSCTRRSARCRPESRMWVDVQGNHGPTAYFSVRDEIRKAEGASASGGIERVLDALQDSVRNHMVADVPVAAFLSAGLDSATLVGLGSRVAGQDLRTLTLGFHRIPGQRQRRNRARATGRAALRGGARNALGHPAGFRGRPRRNPRRDGPAHHRRREHLPLEARRRPGRA